MQRKVYDRSWGDLKFHSAIRGEFEVPLWTNVSSFRILLRGVLSRLHSGNMSIPLNHAVCLWVPVGNQWVPLYISVLKF